jgi:steroid delta-isomerase-like uncharacterized protein
MGAALDAVKHFYDAFARGDMDAADAVYAEDCAFDMPGGAADKAGHRQMGEAFRGGLPDAHMTIDHVLDGDDEVFVEGHFAGTHTGNLVSPQGALPPSGNKVDLRYGDYFRVRDGLIVEHRAYWDQGEMMQQLGVAPG